MARGELTDAFIRTAPVGRHHDGAGYGLFLIVAPSTRKDAGGAPAGELVRSWGQRLRIGGRRVEIGLGRHPLITLAAARNAAIDNARRVAAGENPVAVKRRPLAPTFQEAAQAYIASMVAGFKSLKHAKQWPSTLAKHAYPLIGTRRVDEIDVADVLRVLKPIWTDMPTTAARVRGRIESVLAWCIAKGHRKAENPATWRGHLATLLPAPRKVRPVRNYPAVSQADAPRFYAALAAREGISARCLQFCALTACRSGEARAARWQHIDLEAAIWTIPPENEKTATGRRVPLSAVAVELLRALPRLADSDVVFFAPRAGMLSDMALSAVMRRMHADDLKGGGRGFVDARSGRPAVPHGLRSTARDWCAENDVPKEIADALLGHVVPGATERAYLRAEVLDRRRNIANRYSDFLTGAGRIVALRA